MEETRLEYILTHSYKAEMISHMKSHPEDFDELIELAMADNKPYSWRASWLLWSCMVRNDDRVQKHMEKLVDILPLREDNQVRELLIVLQRMELKDDIEGKLFDHCIKIWEKTAKRASVRYNAFRLMLMIMDRHQELLKEIDYLTEPQYMESLSETAQRCINTMISVRRQRIK